MATGHPLNHGYTSTSALCWMQEKFAQFVNQSLCICWGGGEGDWCSRSSEVIGSIGPCLGARPTSDGRRRVSRYFWALWSNDGRMCSDVSSRKEESRRDLSHPSRCDVPSHTTLLASNRTAEESSHHPHKHCWTSQLQSWGCCRCCFLRFWELIHHPLNTALWDWKPFVGVVYSSCSPVQRLLA